MAKARLLVERGPVRAPSQDWGHYEFVSLPSPGDRVAAYYDGASHYLTVICVHHKPVPATDPPNGVETNPTAEVVAKWTSSDN